MGRQKNDGRGRLGGRAPGTPNKEKEAKRYLRDHSQKYLQPRPQVDSEGFPRKILINGTDKPIILADNEGKPLVMSDLEVDILMLEPQERVYAELKILKFHTPEMKAVDVDMNVRGGNLTIDARLKQLITEEED